MDECMYVNLWNWGLLRIGIGRIAVLPQYRQTWQEKLPTILRPKNNMAMNVATFLVLDHCSDSRRLPKNITDCEIES